MANYAEIIDGKVNQVLVFQGTEADALLWLKENISDNLWVATKEDGSDKGKYAGRGDEYHADIELFIRKPFDSWTLDKGRKMYLPPIPMPLAVPVGYIWKWSVGLNAWVQKRIKEI